ncbi:MAG: SlyX family protein [Candidatus Omnitrophica bacterium]|nr:SlyX family protein [Candidatus Omnitrophota bacterium]
MEERIIELEKRAAFQDAEIKDLSNALMRQHKEIEALTKSLTLLKEKAESGSLVKDVQDEEPPPHY